MEPSAEQHEDDLRERYRELLEELRTIIPGVQVLFAFLLTVPFSARFTALDALGVHVFAAAITTVGLATALVGIVVGTAVVLWFALPLLRGDSADDRDGGDADYDRGRAG